MQHDHSTPRLVELSDSATYCRNIIAMKCKTPSGDWLDGVLLLRNEQQMAVMPNFFQKPWDDYFPSPTALVQLPLNFLSHA